MCTAKLGGFIAERRYNALYRGPARRLGRDF
jgi:hypothetical protein